MNMKKFLLMFITMTTSTSCFAEDLSTIPTQSLQEKTATAEASLDDKQKEVLVGIDAKIAKAKEKGKSTANLERKRKKVIQRIESKKQALHKRVQIKKATIKTK